MSDNTETEIPKEKGSKKTLLIVSLFLIINIVGICGGIYYLSLQSSAPCKELPANEADYIAGEVYCDDETNQAVDIEAVADEGVGVSKEELSGDPLFHKVGPMIVNLLNSERFEYIQFTVTVKTRSLKLIALIESYDPPLRNAFENVVRSFGSEEVMQAGKREKATEQIEFQLHKLLEKEGFSPSLIEDLFISDVIIE